VNGLSLFTGSGIGELAFKQIIPGYKTVGYVEIDRYCRAIIRARIRDGILDDAPVFDDIREFNRRYASFYAGKVDILSGGFPCQPFSVAGKRKGKDDSRNLWPETARAIGMVRPRFALLENVPGLFAHQYIERIFGDCTEMGYGLEWANVSAADVGAAHLREREWMLVRDTNGSDRDEGSIKRVSTRQETEPARIREAVANPAISESRITDQQQGRKGSRARSEAIPNSESLCGSAIERSEPDGVLSSDVPNTESTERESASDSRARGNGFADGGCDWWATEPDVGGMVDGLAAKLDFVRTTETRRLRGLEK